MTDTWGPLYLLATGEYWEPCHTWSDNNSTWIDAYTFHTNDTPGKRKRILDIGCTGDTCCVEPHEAEKAARIWNEGKVMCRKPARSRRARTLIIPAEALNSALILEALTRYETNRTVIIRSETF